MPLGFQVAGQRAANRSQRRRGSSQIVALVPDLREIEPGAIAHVERHVVVEQRLEDPAGFLVLAEREIQAALEQLGFDGVMRRCDRNPARRRAASAPAGSRPDRNRRARRPSADPSRPAACRSAASPRLASCARASSRSRRQRQRASDGGSQHAATGTALTQPVTRSSAAISLPFLDDEFGLRLDRAVADLQLDVLRADALLELDRRAAAIVAHVRALAR